MNDMQSDGQILPDSSAPERPDYLTCRCNHCSQIIEFPAQSVGAEIPCPHCGLNTLLYSIDSVPVKLSTGVEKVGENRRNPVPNWSVMIPLKRKQLLAVMAVVIFL